ncbi:tRNA 5-methylaminomethyl-2-thiouridine synthase TusB [hydrothermal vent metagenome]|uniref:tRNA 5-methylaminomethyl-2-thiouridine synthase TusB n=1 Tax=hydrothermal vent metagenome TaxID=652676 RepID=A0A1W1BM47_9ZZZZ
MLHIVNKSPFERNSLESCMKVIDDKSIVLLIEDGVIGASKTSKADLVKEYATAGKVYVLKGDLEARGIEDNKVIEGIQLVDYSGFVNLVVEHGTPVSWV